MVDKALADAPAESLERLYERVREITGDELYDIQKLVVVANTKDLKKIRRK